MGIFVALAALALAGGEVGTAAKSAVPPPAMLGFVDAATLSGFCNASGPTARQGWSICLSYVTGAADQLLAEQALGAREEQTICLPRNVTAQAVMGAVNTYAAWSSKAKGVSGANFVKFALEQAYPCDAIDSERM